MHKGMPAVYVQYENPSLQTLQSHSRMTPPLSVTQKQEVNIGTDKLEHDEWLQENVIREI